MSFVYVDSDIYRKANRLRHLRLIKLADSLYAMRTVDEYTDVTLVCQGKQFGAHKLILEISSPYFKAMFRSGMKEAKSGRVEFKSIKPETMEAILKYMYVGDVATLTTLEHVADVLAAAHLMELSELSEHCFDVLSSLMSKENCVDIWHIASIYEHQTFTDTVLGYVLANFKELEKTDVFLEMSDIKLKQILNFGVKEQVCLDDMLRFVLDWLRHDIRQRKKCVNELFSCIEPKYLSPDCLKGLIHDKDVMTISPGITSKMNELGAAVLVLADAWYSWTRGTLQLAIPDINKITTDKRSSPKMIKNLPWNIWLKHESIVGAKGKIGFYVECNPKSVDKSWSCNANIEYKLLNCNHREIPAITHKSQLLFSSEARSWGYSPFVDLDEVAGFLKDYLSKDATVIFEAKITTDPPNGIAD